MTCLVVNITHNNYCKSNTAVTISSVNKINFVTFRHIISIRKYFFALVKVAVALEYSSVAPSIRYLFGRGPWLLALLDRRQRSRSQVGGGEAGVGL